MTRYLVGIVTEIDPKLCRARVKYPELDGLVSPMMPVGVRKSLKDKDYWMPDPGDQVGTLLDETAESGVILCAIYSEADMPPIDDPDKFHRRFGDGTVIEYDRKAHRLKVECVGDIEIEATGDVKITAAGAIKLTADRIDLN